MYNELLDDDKIFQEAKEGIEPVWSIDFSKEDEGLKWIKDAYDETTDIVEKKALDWFRNLGLYKGVHYRTASSSERQSAEGRSRIIADYSKVIVNELYDFVESRVSRLSRFEPTVVAVPHSNEHSDKEGAQFVKALFETWRHEFDIPRIKREADRRAAIYGDAFSLILWDKDAGDLDPKWLEAQKELGNKRGEVEVDGEKFKYDPKKPKRIGDVCIKRPYPWELRFDPTIDPHEAQWVMYVRYEHIEKVKKDYPKKATALKVGEGLMQFDTQTLYSEPIANHVMVIELWVRSSKYQAEGMYLKCTPDTYLEGPVENPYPMQDRDEFGNLPVVKRTDIHADGDFYGFPTLNVLANTQHALNQLYFLAKKSILLAAHPKLLVPNQGKVNVDSLGNDTTVVRYNHPFQPQIATYNALRPEVFNFIEVLSSKLVQISGNQPISKGNMDSNIRSGRMIRLLEELESLRATETVKESERFVVAMYRKMLAVAGKFYREDDDRLLRIVGKDKEFIIDSFKASVLSKPYDVRVLPSSNLPQTPSARIGAVAELMQIPGFQTLLPQQQWADMLDLGAPEKFYDAARAALSKAEWENEEIIQGRTPPEPIDGDDHVVHWKTHCTLIESKAFLEFSEGMQEDLTNHLLVHEMDMYDHMQKNPAFQQVLLSLPGFPKYYEPMPAPAPVQAPVQGGGQEQQAVEAPPGESGVAQNENDVAI